MMAFGLGQRRGVLDKGEGAGKVPETVGALDPGSLIEQGPIRCLAAILFGRLAGQWRDAAAAGGAAFLGKCRGHGDPPFATGRHRAILDVIRATVPYCLGFATVRRAAGYPDQHR
jgi:hypothetical protein